MVGRGGKAGRNSQKEQQLAGQQDDSDHLDQDDDDHEDEDAGDDEEEGECVGPAQHGGKSMC